MNNIAFFYMRIVGMFIAIISFIIPGKNIKNIDLVITNNVTTQNDTIELEMQNNSGFIIVTDYCFVLEEKKNDAWVTIELQSGTIEPSIAIAPGSYLKQRIDVIEMFGDYLSCGEYRLSKNYSLSYSITPEYACSVCFSIID